MSFFCKQDVFVGAEFDVGAGVFRVENFVPDFDFHFSATAVIVALAGAHGRDFAYLGLFLSCVGQKDAAGGFFLR
jgi:hypothetical protein